MEKVHIILITFPQVLIENDLHLGINAKLDLEEMGSSTQLCIEKWYRT